MENTDHTHLVWIHNRAGTGRVITVDGEHTKTAMQWAVLTACSRAYAARVADVVYCLSATFRKEGPSGATFRVNLRNDAPVAVERLDLEG